MYTLFKFKMQEKEQIINNFMKEGKLVYLRRTKGIERQFRYNCSGCGLFCAYRPDPFKTESQ